MRSETGQAVSRRPDLHRDRTPGADRGGRHRHHRRAGLRAGLPGPHRRESRNQQGRDLYHFGGKDDLIRELVAELSARGRAYLGPRLEAEPTGAGMLRTYIESNLAFMRGEPQPRGRGRRDRAQRPQRRRQPAVRHSHPRCRGGRAARTARSFPGHRRVPGRLRPAGHGDGDPRRPRRGASPGSPAIPDSTSATTAAS